MPWGKGEGTNQRYFWGKEGAMSSQLGGETGGRRKQSI